VAAIGGNTLFLYFFIAVVNYYPLQYHNLLLNDLRALIDLEMIFLNIKL